MTSKLQCAIRQAVNYVMRFEVGGAWGAASQCIA